MPDTWDGPAADAMLDAHEYRQLDALLRSWIDGARSHEAVDWVDRRAEEGHVPLIYHAARNLAKGGSGGRVMNGAEFRRAFRLALMLLVRSAQDVLSIAVVQGQAPRAPVFSMLRDKVFGWLSEQFPLSRWPPLCDVLAEVERGMPAVLPLPAWVLSAGPGFAATYLHLGAYLGFENPSDKTVAACEKTRVPLDEERARVGHAFFTMLGGMSWEGVTGIGVSAFLAGAGSPLATASEAKELTRGTRDYASMTPVALGSPHAAQPPPPFLVWSNTERGRKAEAIRSESVAKDAELGTSSAPDELRSERVPDISSHVSQGAPASEGASGVASPQGARVGSERSEGARVGSERSEGARVGSERSEGAPPSRSEHHHRAASPSPASAAGSFNKKSREARGKGAPVEA
jgi:hypothetical protein